MYTEMSHHPDFVSLTKALEKMRYKKITEEAQTTNLLIVATAATTLYKSAKKKKAGKSVLAAASKIVNASNGLLDLIDAAHTGVETASAKEVTATAKKVKSNLKKFINLVREHAVLETADLYRTEDAAVSDSEKGAVAEAITKVGQSEIQKLLLEYTDVIKGKQKHSAKLPKSVDDISSFSLTLLPIVPVTPLRKSDFESMGMSVTQLGMYSILNDQLVLGINPKTVNQSTLDKIVKTLNVKNNERYMVVEPPVGYKNSGILYYWLLSEKDIAQLRKATGKFFKISNWGFAFR